MSNNKFSKNNIKAVLFDLDGTIVDTERIYRSCWPIAFKQFGYDLTDEQALYKRSLSQPYVYDYFKGLFGDQIDYDAIKNYCVTLVEDRLNAEGIKLKKGVKETLEYLKNTNLKTAIVTASDVNRAEKYISDLNILGYFDNIISTKLVKNGKPAKDVYIYACNELNVEPFECLAIEDSPHGITSAYNAGCNVIMIPDQSLPTDDDKNKIVDCFDDMSKIIDLLK